MVKVTSEYIRTLQLSEMDVDTTVALVNTAFTKLAEYQVPAKQRLFFGNGAIQLGVDDRGVFTLDVSTSAPADIPGIARLVLRDANGVRSLFIREDLSADLNASAGGVRVGKGGRTGIGSNLPYVGEDDYLVIEYKSDAASATATAADSTGAIPITVQTLA